MRTESRTLYTFGELSEAAKSRAIDHNREWNVDREWWDGVYEDASRIGLQITWFDLGRRSECGGQLTDSAENVARSIIAEHGPDCETVDTAKAYLSDLASIPLDEEGEFDEGELESAEKYFLDALLEDYRIILQHEYEYLTSAKCVAESLEANGAEFLEDGSMP